MQKWTPILLVTLFFALSDATEGTTFPPLQEIETQQATIERLYRVAENAITRKKYQHALNSYQEILDIDNGQLLDLSSRYEVQIRLAQSHFHLKQLDRAQETLNQPLAEELPSHLYLKAMQLQARILHADDQLQQAYHTLKEIDSQFISIQWKSEDRAFYVQLEEVLHKKFEDKLKRAERLFDAAMHSEAIPLYEELLQGINEDIFADNWASITVKLSFRLAQTYFLEDDYKKVIAILYGQPIESFANDPELWTIFRNSAYLLGTSYRHLALYHEAIEHFQRYLAFEDREALAYYEETLWEIGLSHFALEDHLTASKYFQAINNDAPGSQLSYQARIYLARIALLNKRYFELEGILDPLAREMPDHNVLQYEINYIRGEAFEKQENFELATTFFEAALPLRNPQQAPWYANSLEKLGWAYLRKGENTTHSAEDRLRAFQQSELYFRRHLTETKEEADYLNLAKLYFAWGTHLDDQDVLAKIEQIVGADGMFVEIDNIAQALLLRARSAPLLADRINLYEELSTPKLQETLAYAEGWLYLGIDLLNQGKQQQNADHLLTKAQEAFQTAFSLLEKRDVSLATIARKLEAEVYTNIGTIEASQQALSIYDSLINNEELWAYTEDPDEVLYHKAHLYLKLGEAEDKTKLAADTLKHALELFPNGAFTSHNRYLLATLFFQQEQYEEAKEAFTHLATTDPLSSLASDSWYWASRCAEQQGLDKKEIRHYRQQIFTLYPDSPRAAEAYFNAYSYAEYLQGNQQTLDHLSGMEAQYPKSRHLIIAHYLLGLNEKQRQLQDLTAAADSFASVVTTFDYCQQARLIPDEDLASFTLIRYRALLERAKAQLAIVERSVGAKREIYLDYAKGTFTELIADLNNQQDKVIAEIKEEAEYGLIQVALAASDLATAEEQLSKVLTSYIEAGQTHGYVLSRAWYEQAKLLRGREEYQAALESLGKAEEAGKDGLLTSDEGFQVSIDKSHCYRALGQLEQAIQSLTDVVHKAADSDYRSQAMFLRAEIYLMQNKNKQAIRQLRIIAESDNPWGQKAKEQLDQNHGYF